MTRYELFVSQGPVTHVFDRKEPGGMHCSIGEVLEMGPIVYHSETDCLITLNDSYYNLWTPIRPGYWANTDCLPSGGLDQISVAQAMNKAEDWFEELLDEEDKE